MEKRRILVIDDEPGICDLFTETFSGVYEVETAGTGQEGVQKFSARPPALVLLDISMPDMTGIDVLSKIRKSGPEVPVIMITAYGTVRTANEAMELGATDYLLKPLKLDKVRSLVEKALTMEHLEKNVKKLREEHRQQSEDDDEGGEAP